MVIENEFFKRRDDVRCLLTDNVNVFKVTYFKASGKYYTEGFYEMTVEYNTSIWQLPEHFTRYCRDYKGMFAVIEFNDKHPTGYPFLILASERV